MKVLFVDNRIDGHHSVYLKTLVANNDDCVVILPERIDCLPHTKQYIIDIDIEKFNIVNYFRWIYHIKKIAKREKVKIIHFLIGDFLMKYFGLGFSLLSEFSVVVTFHHFRYDFLRNIARRQVFKSIDVGVVHTSALLERAQSEKIYNCRHIEYPCFGSHEIRKDAKKYFGIPEDGTKVLLALGGTRRDKGLDILLDSLRYIKQPYYLLIAGNPIEYDEKFITNNYSIICDKLFVWLKYLSDDELLLAVSASDIVVLPYRKVFDGASGPLTYGVVYQKVIIGPDHGSVGNLVKNNNLGYTFVAEDVASLANTIEKSLDEEFIVDEKYLQYKNNLDENVFAEKYTDLYRTLV